MYRQEQIIAKKSNVSGLLLVAYIFLGLIAVYYMFWDSEDIFRQILSYFMLLVTCFEFATLVCYLLMPKTLIELKDEYIVIGKILHNKEILELKDIASIEFKNTMTKTNACSFGKLTINTAKLTRINIRHVKDVEIACEKLRHFVTEYKKTNSFS